MGFTYNEAKRAIASGEIDFASDDIRALLVMSNTTADTDDDVNTISGITTLDEFGGANYARKALTGEAVSEDAGNNKATFDADNPVWTALGNGARQIAGVVIYKHVTNDADSVPLFYMDGGSFPFDPGGADVTLQFPGGIVANFT